MRDERKELNNVNEMYLWAGLIMLGLHFYVHLYGLFANFGLVHPISEKLVDGFAKNSTLFSSHWTLKLLAGGCIGLYGYASRGVKSITLTPQSVIRSLLIAVVLYVGSTVILINSDWLTGLTGINEVGFAYLALSVAGVLYILKGFQGINRLMPVKVGKDRFNAENETFPQEERKLENPHSVNIPTEYVYEGARKGWLNISAPFRATLIMGSPGSGKTFSIVHSVIRQHIEKGLSMYVYDYKYPSLSLVAFNALRKHHKKLPKNLKFYSINFDDHKKSHRCNPLHPDYLPTLQSAVETSRMILLNLNKKWIEKQGEYFVESPVNYVSALIWFLRSYDKGQYCTFPHLIELVTRNYRTLLPILADQPELNPLMSAFISAMQGGAIEQLEGQISSAQMGLARLSSPSVYWTMSGNDFMLDINNKEHPKILCLGNNQAVKDTYGAALGLYNFRIMNLINRPNQHPASLVVDELPTIYFRGLSDFIATVRSNEVAVTIGMQDFSQLEKDYGRVEAESIKNTCGNVISGQVFDKTAEAMQNRLGKIVQRKDSINIQSEDTTHGISTELNYMVPAAKIGQLTQGWMVGVMSDNVGQESPHKAFHARIAIDKKEFDAEQKVKVLPDFSIFAKDDATLAANVEANYHQIKDDIAQLVASELARLNRKYGK